ncbi:MAG: helicase-related protein [Pseudomonadota bacterium]
MSWRKDLEAIQSLGSQDQGATSLAGLHEARKRHLAQFFTPLAVVEIMWAIAQQSFHHREASRISLLDSSIGTARLMHFADPERHHIGGVDIHEDVVSQVMQQAEAQNLSAEVLCAGMQDIRPTGFDVALLNPPFSIALESAGLTAFPCTKHGRLGPNTSTQSDEYAVAQSLTAADVVVAVVPQSLARDLRDRGADIVGEDAGKRLRAVVKLGTKAFLEEGASVGTCIVVYGHDEGPFLGEFEPMNPSDLPDFGLVIRKVGLKPRLRPVSYDTDKPVITMPITGNPTVRVTHSGRQINLHFQCGGFQARVLNAVYRKRVYSSENHRLPKGVKYAGQGQLDIESILMTDDPQQTFAELVQTIRDAGGEPAVDPTLANYLRKKIRALPRLLTPLGHWVFRSDHADKVTATAKCRVPSEPKLMMAPAVKTGEQIELVRNSEGWEFTLKAWTRKLCDEEARRLFEMPATSTGWVEAHKPLQTHFPVMAAQLEKEARALGIDKFLNWSFQFQDLIEVCIRPAGTVIAFKQGLGKSRIAAGLILLKRVKHGLVTMPANLLDEFGNRLKDAGLPSSMWKMIECAEDLRELRTINIISNERLRMPISSDSVEVLEEEETEGGKKLAVRSQKRSRNTYAKKLRGRIGVLICDEGDFLANPDSAQSRAVAQVSAKSVFPLSGTPIANVPRNMINLAVQSVGDGVAGQVYGVHAPLLQGANAKSMEFATRGVESFADRFVTLEWVTSEFKEDLVKGAKREVPKLRNLPEFRSWLAPFVKRRLQTEPEVRKDVQIPVPTTNVTTLDWQDDHLGYYLRVADEFATWFMKQRDRPQGTNLIALLARIGAVEQAASFPQRSRSGVNWSGGLTNHQQYVVDRTVEKVLEGHKVVLFATWPELLEIYRKEIDRHIGVEAVCYHGALSKTQRRENLRGFRHGTADVLCASFGITDAGLDLYEADYAIFPHRLWNSRGEDQSIYRLLRPQQTRPVHVEMVHLEGSIHEYQMQMVDWKKSTADAGLDWGTPLPDDVEFLHLDTVLGRFLENLAKLRGMKGYELRDSIKALA